MPDRLRLARLSGTVAPVVSLGCILLATLLAPWFSWTDDALSELGVTATSAVAPLFNYGLVVGGLLAVPYGLALWADTASRSSSPDRGLLDGLAGRLVAVLFTASALSMALIGVFPIPARLSLGGTTVEPHFSVAVGFYLGLTATLAVDGLRRVRQAAGQVALLLAVGHIGYWLAWAQGFRLGPGLAIPETVGALALTAWLWGVSPSRPAALSRLHRRVLRSD
ncbi:DUF998 domain-containing protein [Salinirubrum litoreum]|uniref:DUF998 domain-containing protein n=1 Tax=Salinirubrum litoreum TaxID=1126234 RepID=A0ABD5R7I1_9EURY|nr:DUF998 domain-containing protein [Salinirubrum litoreum]